MEKIVKDQVLSNEVVNDQGFVILNDGVNWDRYKKNPILLYGHNWDAPIGNVVKIHRDENGDWRGTLVFDGVTELSREKRDQYLAGTLRGVSLSGKAYYTKQGDIKFATRFDVYEISLLSIPSNPDAVDTVEGGEEIMVGFCATESEHIEQLSSAQDATLTNYLKKMKTEKPTATQTAEQATEQVALEGTPATAEAAANETEVQSQEEFSAAAPAASEENLSSLGERMIKSFGDFMKAVGISRKRVANDSDMEEEDRRAAEETREAEERTEFASAATPTPAIEKPAARILNVEETAQKTQKQHVNLNSFMERKTIHEFLNDRTGKDKFSEMTRFSAAIPHMSPQAVEQDSRMNLIREFVHFAAKDSGFMAAMGDVNFKVNSGADEPLRNAIGRLEQFASGLNSMNFIESTPDLAKIEWSTLIYRELLPPDSWADRIARISAEDVAGVIWVNSAIKPKIYYGNRPPMNNLGVTYDDDPVGIVMKLFALQNIVWQQANTDLLAYDDVALGTSEALRWLSSKAHNYILQKLAESASVVVGTTGTATYSAANAFPANPTATGTLKEIAPADLLALQTAFINQNFQMETFDADMVMPAIFHQQLQSNATLVNLLTKNAGSMRPTYGEYSGFNFRPRSITGLYDTASSKVIDPELYCDGKIADADGSIPAYTPPVIPATAYGLALGLIPSEGIIGIGRTNVHMVTNPSDYGWQMSIDMRIGAGPARKGGLGIGVIYPSVQAGS